MKKGACGEYILGVYQSMQDVESQHSHEQFYKTLSAEHQSVGLPVNLQLSSLSDTFIRGELVFDPSSCPSFGHFNFIYVMLCVGDQTGEAY